MDHACTYTYNLTSSHTHKCAHSFMEYAFILKHKQWYLHNIQYWNNTNNSGSLGWDPKKVDGRHNNASVFFESQSDSHFDIRISIKLSKMWQHHWYVPRHNFNPRQFIIFLWMWQQHWYVPHHDLKKHQLHDFRVVAATQLRTTL